MALNVNPDNYMLSALGQMDRSANAPTPLDQMWKRKITEAHLGNETTQAEATMMNAQTNAGKLGIEKQSAEQAKLAQEQNMMKIMQTIQEVGPQTDYSDAGQREYSIKVRNALIEKGVPSDIIENLNYQSAAKMAEKPAPTIGSINLGGEAESAFAKKLGGNQADAFTAAQQGAEKAVISVDTLNQAKQQINKGIISGGGANIVTTVGNYLQQVGLYQGDAVSNTQEFMATMAKETLNILGSGDLGSGTGISDNDRLFAARIAGGDISLQEDAIKRMIEINAKAKRAKIKAFNEKAQAVDQKGVTGAPYPSSVPVPDFQPFKGNVYTNTNKPPKNDFSYGDVYKGYRYLGGDPLSKDSWEPLSVWND